VTARSPDDRGLPNGAGGGDTTAPLLRIRGVTGPFGPIVALSDVRSRVRSGEILGLIGTNGRPARPPCQLHEPAVRGRARVESSSTAGRCSTSPPRLARVGIGLLSTHRVCSNTMPVTTVMVGTSRARGGFGADASGSGPWARRAPGRERACQLRGGLVRAARTSRRSRTCRRRGPFPVKKAGELDARAGVRAQAACCSTSGRRAQPRGGRAHGRDGTDDRGAFGVTFLIGRAPPQLRMRVSDRVVAGGDLDFGRTGQGTPAEIAGPPEVIRALPGESRHARDARPGGRRRKLRRDNMLRGVSLEAPNGGMVALIRANGEGKKTNDAAREL